MNQQTLKKEYTFEGRGLHTGKFAHLTLCPAPENFGIKFLRTDLNVVIPALCIKKVRICPEVFFKPLPKRERKRVFVSRGRLKYNAPPSVFLIEY